MGSGQLMTLYHSLRSAVYSNAPDTNVYSNAPDTNVYSNAPDTNCKGGGKREIREKTRRPVASFGTVPTCENPGATPPGNEPSLHRREESGLSLTPPQPLQHCTQFLTCTTAKTTFNLSYSDDRVLHVRRYRGNRNLAACIVERHSGQTPSVMAWGAIVYNMRSLLLRIGGNLISNHYIRNVLEYEALPLLTCWCRNEVAVPVLHREETVLDEMAATDRCRPA
ncbi:hypothetical protein PR048_006137 [Dryococelus australis]|uniref:Uncharacterized protein n=1 Tax=Dryococelus australis TaxID=614101 RepID=A0ABQ9IA46_9NEOP|nr:hypothetical protein PR048_006137 [Dryococelus australis]